MRNLIVVSAKPGPLTIFPQDLTSALTLKIAFRRYSFSQLLRRDGIVLSERQIVGFSRWNNSHREFLLQGNSYLTRILIRGPQPIDRAISLDRILELAPAPRSFVSRCLLDPENRKKLTHYCVLGMSFAVHANFGYHLAIGQFMDLVSLPLVAATLGCGPFISVVAALLHRQGKH